MTNTIHEDRAFPTANHLTGGLTKREYFAAIICGGLAANGDISTAATENGLTPVKVQIVYAEAAVKSADALIEALNRIKPTTT